MKIPNKLLALGSSILFGCSPVLAADCTSLSPSPMASVNVSNIQSCVDSGYAKLNSGVFEVDATIYLRNGSTLKGSPSRIKLVKPALSLLSIGSNAQASFLNLDANNQTKDKSAAVVYFEGNNSLLDNSHAYNSYGVGIYFIGLESNGNRVINSQVHHNFLGVIFRNAYATQNINKVQGSQIRDNYCDGIAFSGFGIASENKIFNNGSDCNNGIPGAGIYAAGNKRGALILSNNIYDNRGHNIDLDRVAYFIIEGNNSYAPGMTSLSLVDSSFNKIRNNVFTNSSSKTKSVKNTTAIKSMSFPNGGVAFQDFPHGERQAIALFIGQRKWNTSESIGNSISDNVIRSYCSPINDCVGMAYFISRNTGYPLSGKWMPNTFNNNNTFGSQYDSRRCGGNWYDDGAVNNGYGNHGCWRY